MLHGNEAVRVRARVRVFPRAACGVLPARGSRALAFAAQKRAHKPYCTETTLLYCGTLVRDDAETPALCELRCAVPAPNTLPRACSCAARKLATPTPEPNVASQANMPSRSSSSSVSSMSDDEARRRKKKALKKAMKKEKKRKAAAWKSTSDLRRDA